MSIIEPRSAVTPGRRSNLGIVTLLLMSPFASACGSATEQSKPSDAAIGTSQEAILGGTDATMAEWGALVKVSSSLGGCSGSILSDTWILTARHCIPGSWQTSAPVHPPGITAKTINGVSRTAVEAYYMPGQYIADPETNEAETMETDVVLLRFDTPFPLDFNQASASAIHYLYPYANAGLEGRQARCAGFGKRTLTGSSGTPSWANIDIESADDDLIFLSPDSSGKKIEAPGDSGGPCTQRTPLATFQFRVTSGGAVEQNSAGQVTAILDSRGPGTQTFRDWALGIMRLGVGLYSDANYKGQAETIANSTLALDRVRHKIASVRVPPGWQVNLWDSFPPGFGNVLTVTGNMASVPPLWREVVAYVEVVQNGVQIFKDPSFTGTTRTLAPGRYDAADLGTLNNTISSLRVPSDWRVRTFANAGFAGRELDLYGSSVGSLGSALNDTISSIVVEQPVTVFTDNFYLGQYQIFWEGNYNVTDMMVPDKSISSIVVPTGFTLTLYEGENQTGASIAFTSHQVWMPDGWDDRVSSVSITRN